MNQALRLSPLLAEDAAAYDAFVVPRYMTLLGEPILEMLLESREAQVVHAFCRTGYPDRALATRLEGAHVFGCDPSPWALSIARGKITERAGLVVDYRAMETPALPFPDAAFSHALCLHPPGGPRERQALLGEYRRLLAPRGQALLSMPLRGSFVEVADLMREHAVKYERIELGRAIDALVEERPTPELLIKEVEGAGFDHIDIDQRARTLKFSSGSDFLMHPLARLFVLRDFRAESTEAVWEEWMAYLQHAIDKYWSGSSFELTLKIGCVSARRKGSL